MKFKIALLMFLVNLKLAPETIALLLICLNITSNIISIIHAV